MSILSGVDCLVSMICPSSIDESESVVSPSSICSSSSSIMVCTGVRYRSPSPKLEDVDDAEGVGDRFNIATGRDGELLSG